MSTLTPVTARRRSARRVAAAHPRVTVRPLARGDFFTWLDAYADHDTRTGRNLGSTHALRVWQWLEGNPSRLEGMVAEIDGRMCGFVLFQETLDATTGRVEMLITDLYEAGDARVHGVGDDLVAALYAEAGRRGVVRLRAVTPAADESALRYLDRVGTRTAYVVHDLPVRASGADGRADGSTAADATAAGRGAGGPAAAAAHPSMEQHPMEDRRADRW